MIKTDQREILDTSPEGRRTEDTDFKAMKLEIKDEMEKHNSLESKRKPKGEP